MKVDGDIVNFNNNWTKRSETSYLHWTRERPINQIQLAFRKHWETFSRIYGPIHDGAKCLEVGCGRGSLSGYFADAGWDCTLLDLSPQVLETAKDIFAQNNLDAEFVEADCNNMPLEDDTFDLVFSIGLLEHFSNIETPLSEQLRVLKKGGTFIGYIVPKFENNIQKDFEWINEILRFVMPDGERDRVEKDKVFRSDSLSERYVPILEKLGLVGIRSSGIYPLPMISNSTEFPFTLLPQKAESVLVEHFEVLLSQNKQSVDGDYWLCDEGFGQAFLVWGQKL